MEAGRLWLELNDLALQLDLEVRMEHLEDSEGYQASSGFCRLGGRMVVFIDPRYSMGERCRQLGLALLNAGDLDDLFMVPYVRDFLTKLESEQIEM
ncbi:hypothetical protein [Dethiosulfatarculus sandiegensis]|uniref:Uncharacterized protein n=1 Tax=Dethiosulfatarculus sandiegensis TaxID=1429043 RepID=A0A0D2JH59_9BACT|nr:hypothetical protein [Dethiosulfatarculus sandiegensis]KIX15061.1 hypothetical protein X474_06025 [Dethiosulfatarculus sandiegensis]